MWNRLTVLSLQSSRAGMRTAAHGDDFRARLDGRVRPSRKAPERPQPPLDCDSSAWPLTSGAAMPDRRAQ